MSPLPLVIIESPFGTRPDGTRCTLDEINENKAYLRECMRDSMIKKAERPFASHALYTQFLDDTNKEERERGLRLGWDFLHGADLVAVYMDRGLTDGMRRGIERAKSVGVPLEERYLF